MKARACSLVLALGCLTGAVAAESNDALLAAANQALTQGQAVAALQVLEQHPTRQSFGRVRLLEARALLVLGRSSEAAARVGSARPEDIERWTEGLRGGVAALNGEISLALGDLIAARGYLELALRLRGGVEMDRTICLLAELCERQGDLAASERYAHVVWRDWPRSPYRARAGLLEARQIWPQRPDEARALLAGVRVQERVEPVTRLGAAELLCHLLLPGKPGQCLVVAEQELARLAMAGRLPLYRALALVALDPVEGLAAIEHLEPTLREDPAVRSTEERLRASPAAVQQESAMRIERARVELELGREQQARAMLEPLAAENPAAMSLLCLVPGMDLSVWMQAPVMDDPTARLALAIALARRGDQTNAWTLFAPLAVGDLAQTPGVDRASVLYWAAYAASAAQAKIAMELRQRLLALPGEGIEIGLTWAAEAQRREQIGASPNEVRLAWERAGVSLPHEHVWQPSALLRAARPLIADGKSLATAALLLERVSAEGEGEDRHRCRFLLAQVYERLERPAEALRLIDELQASANGDQREKLDRMRVRLGHGDTTEAQLGPLDAEN